MSQYNKISRVVSFLFAVLFVSSPMMASHVPMNKAKEIARIAYAMKSNVVVRSANQIQVVEEYTQMTGDEASYYIFNMAPRGFVVVSAEEDYNAILAFSDEGQFNFDESIAWPAMSTLGSHERRIAYNRENDVKPTPSIAREWETLNASSVAQYVGKSNPDGVVVPPLTTTSWGQGEFYNEFTPRDADPDAIAGGAYCGCAPIAMAQLIKYHNYPAQGHGFNSYEDPVYGDIAVDFCRPYNWSNMPDSLTAPNQDVAEFIYHVGAATNSEFSITYTSTFISFMRDALVNFFNYDEAAEWFFDGDADQFANVAINDLNQGRPLMLSGEAWVGDVFAGAHTWVTDGYGFFLDPVGDQPDEYFHFNWGWSGDNNGWFLDTNNAAWDPIPGTFGTRPITFWHRRYVIHNIFPAQNNCGAPKSLYTSQVTPRSVFFNTDYVTEYDQPYTFRYRQVGTTDWIETNPTNNYYSRATGLEPDTEYEYQVRKQCCSGAWSDYGPSETFRTEAVQLTNPCLTLVQSSLTTNSVTEESAYLNTSRPYGAINNQFRYRFVGSFFWSFSTVSVDYFRFIDNLEPGTEYEFQVRHACSNTTWSEFSNSSFFRTQGNVNSCSEEFEINLFTSSTTETQSYIYTTQPYGRVDNEFRYRATDATDWELTEASTSYYRYLTGLEEGTEYEFQVRHNCGGSDFSDWSFSHTLTTLGGAAVDCEEILGDRLYFSSVSESNAYIYTPQPYGQVANEFRYRADGVSDWTTSSVSTLYYRFLSELTASTRYEFQVRHECQIGSWTDWSVSQSFTTTPGFGGGAISSRSVVLPPRESAEFSEDLLQSNSMSVFPNPTDADMNIELAFPLVSSAQGSIIDLSGRAVQQFTVAADNQVIRLDVSDLTAGIYLLAINSDNQQMIQKVIIH